MKQFFLTFTMALSGAIVGAVSLFFISWILSSIITHFVRNADVMSLALLLGLFSVALDIIGFLGGMYLGIRYSRKFFTNKLNQ